MARAYERNLTGIVAVVCLNRESDDPGVNMRAAGWGRRAAATAAGALAIMLTLAGCSANGAVTLDVPTQVDAQLPAETVQQMQDAVTSAMVATGSSGAIVGVWAPWSGTWVTGLGTESATDPTPVGVDDGFRVSRVTRAMTCDALYSMVGEGKLALEDSVTKYVSGVPDLENITLGQLCDSTSGIGSYKPRLFGMWLANPDRDWNPRELVSYGLGQPLTGTPGTAFVDSDAGYALLGLALERAAGMSASDVLETYVFSRLELGSTSLPGGTAAPPAVAGSSLLGHHSIAGADGVMNCTEPLDITTFSSSTGYTDSGAVSTIADLGRYSQSLATGALEPSGIDRLAEPLVIAGAPSWLTTRGGVIQAASLVGQFGSVPGYMSAAFSDTNTGLTVAVVLNNSGAADTLGAYLAWELAAIASKAPAAGGQSAPDAGLPWTAQQFHDTIAANAICAAPAP
ncbi:serine hydrolase domain-containing protein [Microbacterium sp. P01]|uniref:serine hydrolase domain-containing protein n=1 Tax=unclassified Microbacterium TaxID=2609290 RepID=UPI003672677A